MLLYSLYCDVMRQKYKDYTGISFITYFCRNQTVFWDLKTQNNVRIAEGSDNGDSDNRGPTVCQIFEFKI